MFELIAFDADDTLWHNEPLYLEAQKKLGRLLAPYASSTEVADHLLYLVRVGELDKALASLETNLPHAADVAEADARFAFYVAAQCVAEGLARKAGKPLRVRVPRELACHRDDDTYEPAELAGWFAAESAELADRFNRRNGNDYFTREIAECRQLAGV